VISLLSLPPEDASGWSYRCAFGWTDQLFAASSAWGEFNVDPASAYGLPWPGLRRRMINELKINDLPNSIQTTCDSFTERKIIKTLLEV